MIAWFLGVIKDLVVGFGAFGVFLGAFLEEVVSFIPSSFVIMFSGFFIMGEMPISAGSFGTLIAKIAVPVAFGLTIGSLILYGIVYYFGEPFLRRFGKYLGVYWEDIEKLQKKMEGSQADELIFLIVRCIPAIPFAAINAFCGLVRWPLRNYLVITFAGSLVRGASVGFLGWQLGRLYEKNAEIFANAERLIFIAIIVFVAGFIYYNRRRRAALNRDIPL